MKARNLTLDLIRAISALVVLAVHLRSIMFKDFSAHPPGYVASIPEQIFYFITSLGHYAVMVFFVLSGYFVGGSILKSKENFNFKSYLTARLTRLWLPLIPMLLFTLCIDSISRTIAPEVIAGEHYSILKTGPTQEYSASVTTFVGNLLFLQKVYVPIFGSNSPLWSLTNEFWYWVTFPSIAIFLGLVGKQNKIMRVVYALITCLIIFFILRNLMLGFLFWCMGLAVYYISEHKKIRYNKWLFLASLLLFILCMVESKMHYLGNPVRKYIDVIVVFNFCLMLLTVIHSKLPDLSFLRLQKKSFWVSEISYTLYISHFPLVILLYSLFYKNAQRTFNATSMLEFFGWYIFLIIVGYAFWYLFERNTLKVRKNVERVLRIGHAPKSENKLQPSIVDLGERK